MEMMKMNGMRRRKRLKRRKTKRKKLRNLCQSKTRQDTCFRRLLQRPARKSAQRSCQPSQAPRKLRLRLLRLRLLRLRKEGSHAAR